MAIAAARAQGPYSRTTAFVVTPQIRLYLGQIKVGLPRNKNETEQARMQTAVKNCYKSTLLTCPARIFLAVAARLHAAAAHG
jgi:hypothetical protein